MHAAAQPDDAGRTVRIAAAGDVHCGEEDGERVAQAFASLAGQADLFLLAGDLTTHGEPAQAAVLAEACRELDMPVVAVLGNHDWHADRVPELVGTLEEAGVQVLDRSTAVVRVQDVDVGVAGVKGFVGGFPGSHLPDFGEPLLRGLHRETGRDVEALEAGLREIAHCPARIVLMHYAPTPGTLAGEPEGIWTMLGSDRLAAPIAEHEPDLVLHGHAHAGAFEAAIARTPVYNVSVPVMRRDHWIFELSGLGRVAAQIH